MHIVPTLKFQGIAPTTNSMIFRSRSTINREDYSQ